jgi:NifB/MoaA-like Fe-S oxidoreductase
LLAILSVLPDSPASAAGFKQTDVLLSCNGKPLDDWIDFLYSAGGLYANIQYSRGGLVRKRTLRRMSGVNWGFLFHGQSPSPCRKKCIFCFVDQLPKNVRQSLRVKDDDVRHSFVHGTYITLNREDTDYAIRKKISPIHISVHSTDPGIRGRILGTGRPEPVLPMLRELSDAGIRTETQIVIVPGLNDAEDLDSSLGDLIEIDGVISIGVVPVGLTKFRDGLPAIRRPDRSESQAILDQCSIWRKRAECIRGSELVFPSDEFFVMADRKIPPREYYRNCTLKENGIGMLSDLLQYEGSTWSGRGAICTGTLAAPFLRRVLLNSNYRVIPVENSFLGPKITVAGLLSGRDIIRSVEMLPDSYNRVVLTDVMFNNEMLTLDDLTAEDIGRSTGREIVVARSLEELI